MKTTINLGLKKPDPTDFVNVEDFNYNADKIDVEVQNLKTGKAPTIHTHAMSDVGITTSSSVSSTSTTTIANSYAVKQAYDRGTNASVLANANKASIENQGKEIANQGKEIENLKSNVNNGKTVLATAIGAPIASTDTFGQMGTKIDTLTNSFKDNLVAKGVAVVQGSKISSLIEAIKKMPTFVKDVGDGEVFISDNTTIECGNSSWTLFKTINIPNDLFGLRVKYVTLGGWGATSKVTHVRNGVVLLSRETSVEPNTNIVLDIPNLVVGDSILMYAKGNSNYEGNVWKGGWKNLLATYSWKKI